MWKIVNKSALVTVCLLILYYLNFNNNRLFNVLTELTIILIGFSIFIITKNTHKVSQNNYFLFLGISFLIASSFNLLHLLTHYDTGIIYAKSNDVSMQLRLASIFIQASSFIVFCWLLYRHNKPAKLNNLLSIYCIFSLLTFVSIMVWGIFPKCYIDGVGFTNFNIISEIVVCIVLLIVIKLLIDNKKNLHEDISLFLIYSLGILVAAELCFTFYTTNGDFINATGHILRLCGNYLIYKAIIQTNLENPYNVLFYRLTEINSSLEIKTRLLMKINEKLNEEIYERTCVEEKLRESKKKYQELLDFLPYAIITHCEGKIVYLNNAALKLIKLDQYKDVLDRSVLEFVHPDYIDIVKKRAEDAYNNISSEVEEIKIVTQDSREIFVETKSVPYTFKDRPASLVVIGDISERKEAEEKEKALKEAREYDRIKNEFMANISHELRTPLNVIFGAVQLIEYYSDNNTVCENRQTIAKYSKSMRQNCYRMLRLVNNLIDLTKIDSGFLKLNLQNHNVVNVVEDITLSVAQYIESKNINIEFDTEVEEKYLACDADMIERIMLNLLSNAVKFTPPQGKICVNLYDNKDSILVSVKDSGIGIPSDMLEIIFDRFRQVDKSLTRSTEGSGIGLNLVKSLVELHGGYISVQSNYGNGSEFVFELPVRTISYDEVAATIEMPQGNVERIHIEFSDIYS
jgi:PAS domain S-box-containing protein